MENIFADDILILENALYNQDLKFMEEMTLFTEQYEETHYITESMMERLSKKFKQLFASMLESFRNFKAQLHVKLNGVMKQKQTKKRLREMIENLKENKKKGAVKATTIDIIKYQKVYLQAYGELWSFAKRIRKGKYHNIDDLEWDVDKFNGIYEKYSDELKEIGNTKIEMPIDKVLEFCQDELYGKSRILKSINDTETKIYLMKVDAENLEKRKEIMGDQILVRRFGLLRGIYSTICKIVKTAVSKFLMWVVFIFA